MIIPYGKIKAMFQTTNQLHVRGKNMNIQNLEALLR